MEPLCTGKDSAEFESAEDLYKFQMLLGQSKILVLMQGKRSTIFPSLEWIDAWNCVNFPFFFFFFSQIYELAVLVFPQSVPDGYAPTYPSMADMEGRLSAVASKRRRRSSPH